MFRLNKAQQKSRMIYRGMEGRMEERTLKLPFKRNSTFFSMFLNTEIGVLLASLSVY